MRLNLSRRYTSGTTKKNFYDWIALAYIIVAIVTVIAFLAVTLAWVVESSDFDREQKIYTTLKGEELVFDDSNKSSIETAQTFKLLYANQYNFSRLNGLEGDNASAARELINSAMKNWNGRAKYLENSSMPLPEDKTADIFFGSVWDFFVFLVLFVPSFIYAIRDGDHQNEWWQYPWKKWWAYPAIILLMPYVVVTQPFVLLYAVVNEGSKFILRKKTIGQVIARGTEAESHNSSLSDSIKKSEEKLKALQTKAKNEGIVFAGDEADSATNGLSNAKYAYDAKNYGSAESYLKGADNYLNSIQKKIDKFEHREEEYEKIIAEAMKRKDESRDKFGRIRETELIAKQEILGNEIATVKQNLSDLGKRIEQSQRVLAVKIKETKEIKERISKGNDQEFLKQFDEISALPLIRAIEAQGRDIKIYTDTIYIIYRGEDEFFKGKYEIGSFMISYNISYSDAEIRNLANTSIAKEGHPYGNGSVCFGNLASHIRKALSERNYVLATLLILQSLQTGEGDNPKKLKYWKKVN